jgi:hypothetical protein
MIRYVASVPLEVKKCVDLILEMSLLSSKGQETASKWIQDMLPKEHYITGICVWLFQSLSIHLKVV